MGSAVHLILCCNIIAFLALSAIRNVATAAAAVRRQTRVIALIVPWWEFMMPAAEPREAVTQHGSWLCTVQYIKLEVWWLVICEQVGSEVKQILIPLRNVLWQCILTSFNHLTTYLSLSLSPPHQPISLPSLQAQPQFSRIWTEVIRSCSFCF